MLIIGIDPGLTGAIAWNKHDEFQVVDMPVNTFDKSKTDKRAKPPNKPTTTKRSNCQKKPVKVKRLDHEYLVDIFQTLDPDMVFIESQHARPISGSTQSFKLGQAYEALIMACVALGYKYRLVTPQSWKKYHDMMKKTKDESRQYAQCLFPDIDLHRKMDHNRADALLICYYGRYLLDNDL